MSAQLCVPERSPPLARSTRNAPAPVQRTKRAAGSAINGPLLAASGHTGAPQHVSAGPNRVNGAVSYAQVVAKQSSGEHTAAQATVPVVDAPVSAADRMAIDDSAANQRDDDELTAPEDLQPKTIELRLLKIAHKLAQRRKQLTRDEQAIIDQEAAIAEQQAALVQLNANADETRDQIRGHIENRTELSQRLARFSASEQGCSAPAMGEEGKSPETTAMECLSRTFLGLQNFETQSPAIKILLSQFAQAVQALQAEHAPPVSQGQQLTLQQAFASTAVQQGGSSTDQSKPAPNHVPAGQSSAGASEGGARHFDISDKTAPHLGQGDGERTEKSYGPISAAAPPGTDPLEQVRPARQGISGLSADRHSEPRAQGKDVPMGGDTEADGATDPAVGSSSDSVDQPAVDQQDALTDCLFKQGLQHWQTVAKKGRVQPY